MWESYNVMRNNAGPDCPRNPNIKAADVKVGTANQGSTIPFDRYSDTYATINYNNVCGAYSFVRPAPGGFASNSWEFNTD